LQVTTENLAEMLEITPNTISNWEFNLGLNIESDDCGIKSYSEALINFFKKVKSLILNGFAILDIKDLLSAEIQSINQVEKPIEVTIIQENKNNEDTIIFVDNKESNSSQRNNSTNNEFSSFTETLKNDLNKSDVIVLFETILKELKQYTDRTIEAEKKVYLLEDFEKRVKQDYFEISSEVKQLRSELEEKEKKIKDYEEQRKRLNLMEVQLKILQLEKNKKKAWEFWK